MSKFASLKKSSADITRLNDAITKMNKPEYEDRETDNTFWKPKLDDAGNGFAIVRFMPAPEIDGDDALPWVRLWSHFFRGPTGKYYVNNSLTTLNQKDPVSEYNSALWSQSDDDNSWQRKQARDQKRKLEYVANIKVLVDPAQPECEGKVYRYKFGKKIFDKILEAINPPFDEMGRAPDHPKYDPTNSFNPFDIFAGAPLKIKIRKQGGFPNYDTSEWGAKGPLDTDEAVMEADYGKCYSLKELVTPDKFKSYEELKKELSEVLGESLEAPAPKAKETSRTSTQPKFEKPKTADTLDEDVPFDVDDEADLDYFKSLADAQ